MGSSPVAHVEGSFSAELSLSPVAPSISRSSLLSDMRSMLGATCDAHLRLDPSTSACDVAGRHRPMRSRKPLVCTSLSPRPDRLHRTIASFGMSRASLMAWAMARSEEHTSELQSLMRISYAVFCL